MSGPEDRVWLVRDDAVLAGAEVARTRGARRRGLRGRASLEGALVLTPCRSVHTFGVAFPIDVAFCGADGTVLRIACLEPRRISRPALRAAFVVEARAGCFERWNLRVGDRLELSGPRS